MTVDRVFPRGSLVKWSSQPPGLLDNLKQQLRYAKSPEDKAMLAYQLYFLFPGDTKRARDYLKQAEKCSKRTSNTELNHDIARAFNYLGAKELITAMNESVWEFYDRICSFLDLQKGSKWGAKNDPAGFALEIFQRSATVTLTSLLLGFNGGQDLESIKEYVENMLVVARGHLSWWFEACPDAPESEPGKRLVEAIERLEKLLETIPTIFQLVEPFYEALEEETKSQ